MTDKALRMAACEINQILRYTEDLDVNKIPLGLRLFLKDIADEKYIPDINPETSLQEHKLMQETKDILGMIYYYYWCDDAERNEISQKRKEEIQRASEAIFQNYSPDEFFKGQKERRKTELEQQALASIPEKEPWYKRLFGWFKKK